MASGASVRTCASLLADTMTELGVAAAAALVLAERQACLPPVVVSEFLSEPKEMPYGVEATFRDDSGNFYSMTERRA